MGINLNNPLEQPFDDFPDKMANLLRHEEGEVLHAYQDSLGYWTIGIGRLIDKRKGGGITREESKYLFNNDLQRIELDLSLRLPWITDLNDARRAVLVSMAFQMGVDGLMKFHTTLAHIEAGRYAQAAISMGQCLWAKQTPARAKRHMVQMELGLWHEY